MNVQFIRLVESYKEWLATLGYARSTVTGSPRYVNAFFFYLESLPADRHGKKIFTLSEITNPVIKDYFVYLSARKNQNKAGTLSLNSLRNNLGALRRFGKYLRETEQGNLEISVQLPESKIQVKEILSHEEISLLYQSTDQTILGMRDIAMLSVYYGCGLRRNEGINLNTSDILFERNKVIVRKGKGNKERIIPITGAVKSDLESYMKYARPVLTERNPKEEAFFISRSGKRISGNMLYERLKRLKEKAGINKDSGLHTLRHSIATHLLQDGMAIDYVSQFLGHSSLESTQIYTSLAYGKN